MESHSIFYLFAADLFHQILFYFGGIAAVVILLAEKWRDRAIPWKWISAFFLFCVFVSCFQAWIDEHHNATALAGEKAKLTSENSLLQAKLDNKQSEVDYLRDHQHVVIQAPIQDPQVAKAIASISETTRALKEQPNKDIKVKLLILVKEMDDFFQSESQAYFKARDATIMYSPSPDPAVRKQQWNQNIQKLESLSEKENQDLQNALVVNFSPRASSLLDDLKTRQSSLGISDEKINGAKNNCIAPMAGGAFMGFPACVEHLAAIANDLK